MTQNNSNSHKNTANYLSYQVRQILNQKGYSFLWNWDDYQYFKSTCKNAFNKAQAIAEKFLEETNTKSDYNEYIF